MIDPRLSTDLCLGCEQIRVLWKRLSRTGLISAEGPSSLAISTTTDMRVRVLASVSRTSLSLRFQNDGLAAAPAASPLSEVAEAAELAVAELMGTPRSAMSRKEMRLGLSLMQTKRLKCALRTMSGGTWQT